MRSRIVQLVGVGTILLLIGTGCVWFGDDEKTKVTQDTPKVAATIFPVFDLVRTVGGDSIQTEIVVDPGISEHFVEPTPGKMRQLQGTEVIFAVGQSLDQYAESLVENLPGARVVTLDRGIQIRPSVEHEDEEEDSEEGHGPTDPHYWLSPADARIMIDTITTELSALVPEQKLDFEARANTLKQQIDQKDDEWRRTIATLPKKEIVTFHDAFYYFAEHFGLTIVATFEPFPGKEPSPKYLIQLQEEIEEHEITHLFLEPQLPQDSLRTFAQDNNITLGLLDPVGGIGERDSYINLIDFNVRQIVQSLQ